MARPLTYGRPKPSEYRARFLRRFALSMAFIALIGWPTVGLLWPCGSNETSICTDCGLLRHSVRRNLPLTPIPIYARTTEQTTAISAVAARRGLRPGHAHTFEICTQWGRDLSSRTIYHGKFRMHPTIADQKWVATFLDNMAVYRGKAAAEKWLTEVLASYISPQFVADRNFPVNGFGDAASFNAWWTQHGPAIELHYGLPMTIQSPHSVPSR